MKRSACVLAAVLLAGCASTAARLPGISKSATAPPVATTSASTTPPTSGPAFLDPAAAAAAAQASGAALTVINSYDYRQLDVTLDAAGKLLTPQYLRTYRTAFESQVVPAATRLHARQSVQILSSGVRSITEESATVLTVASIVTTHDRTTEPPNLVSVLVSLERLGAKWLVNDYGTADGPDDPAPGPGTPELQAAYRSAARVGVDLLSFRRAQFDQDFARALSATTDALRADLLGRRDETLRTLQAQRVDLLATLSAGGVVRATPREVVVLLSLNGGVVDASGKRADTGVQRLELTMVPGPGGSWLGSDLRALTAPG